MEERSMCDRRGGGGQGWRIRWEVGPGEQVACVNQEWL